MIVLASAVRADEAPAVYRDSTKPIDARVQDLLSRMTLQEKADQLTQAVESDQNPNNAKDQSAASDRLAYGSFIARPDAEKLNAYQKAVLGHSRLGIPALFGLDVIHGCFLGFPIPLAQACAWNPDLVRRSCSFAAREARHAGIAWTFSPMIDVTVDPRWGRIAEGYGESPYAASVFAAAAVKGYQGDSLDSPDTVAATLKHYVAYGASEGGRDYSYTDVSPVRLWSMYLPPYEAGVKAGAATVMTAFNDLDGIPMTENHYLLTDVLRGQFGFQGVVVTDYGAVDQLMTQGVAADPQDAMKEAFNAGVDIDMMSFAATRYLPGLVQAGSVSEQRLDESIRRVLRLKFGLGLFDHPFTKSEDKIPAAREKEGEEIAEELAEQSVVLLKNDGGTLPISPPVRKIALIGPIAEDRREVLGAWNCACEPDRTISIERGLREALPDGTSLKTERGCEIDAQDTSGFAAAVALARESDVVILCLGEGALMSGENASRSSLRLPGVQEELALAIAETGKPVVLVISSGRPVELGRVEGKMKAILAIWQPGHMAGSAVANVLLGKTNPSGRLAVTWPRSSGQIPIYHNMHPRARTGDQGIYKNGPTSPQYEFGYGLSYTTFHYGPITLKAPTMRMTGEELAQVTVTNTGKLDGSETVFWFINRPVASISQPIKELKHFEKAMIPAGGSHVFEFAIEADRDLSYRDAEGKRVLEPGVINLMAGGQRVGFRVEE